jgi:hypothetical protein
MSPLRPLLTISVPLPSGTRCAAPPPTAPPPPSERVEGPICHEMVRGHRGTCHPAPRPRGYRARSHAAAVLPFKCIRVAIGRLLCVQNASKVLLLVIQLGASGGCRARHLFDTACLFVGSWKRRHGKE